MPHRPENRAFYRSPLWRERSDYIVMVRARGRCEVCGVAVHGLPIPHKELSPDPRSEITIEDLHLYLRDHRWTNVYLTCSHWYDPTKENLSANNLRAACQACHNGRDGPYRARNAAETRRRRGRP